MFVQQEKNAAIDDWQKLVRAGVDWIELVNES